MSELIPAGIISAGRTWRPVSSVVADEAHQRSLGNADSFAPTASFTAASICEVQFFHCATYASVLKFHLELG